MPKLSELKPGLQRKVLVVGPSGTGKTVFALSLPGAKYIFDFDRKVSSGASFYADRPSQLEGVEYEQYDGAPGTSGPLPQFEAHLRALEAKRDAFPYAVVALDSFTTFIDKVLEHVIATNPAIQRTRTAQGPVACQLDYRIATTYAKNVIHRLLSLPAHFILTAHIHVEKDELTGRIERRAKGPDSIASYLPVVFEEVYRTFVETKGNERFYRAQTRADDYYAARTQIKGLPAVIPLSPESLK